MSGADPIGARLDGLWANGVFRGAGPDLNELAALHHAHPRADELRAFADIAVLLEGEFGRLRPPGAYAVDPALPRSVRALGHAAATWRAAVSGDLEQAAFIARRAESALAEHGAADPRSPTAAAYTDLALAELHYHGGDHAATRGRLKAVSTRAGAPPAARLAARGRLATIVGARDPKLGVSALDNLARAARRLNQPVEVLHAQLGAAILLLHSAQAAEARRRLHAMVSAPVPAQAVRYETAARLLLAMLADATGDDPLEQANEGLRLAAAEGDTFAYIVLVGLATRLHLARGEAAEALLTVTAGIQQLRGVGGDALALALIGEREALRRELGEPAWEAAIEAAHAKLGG